MQDAPSAPLVELLEDLNLACEDDFRQVRSLAQRLAPDLPLFDSIWLDALVQARRITPFQAREINSGRGTELIVGPYVLVRPATGPAYARVYQAKLRNGDATVRLLPGVLGNPTSAAEDSFGGGLLEGPQYTRPPIYRGLSVPEVLRSGDHAAIARWRRERALERTRERRPDLLDRDASGSATRADVDRRTDADDTRN